MKSLQRRATVGLILAAGVGIAFLLRGIGLEIGTGTNNGPQATTQPGNSPADLGIVADLVPSETETKPDQPKQETVELPDNSKMVTMIVEEKHYLLGTNATPPESVQSIELAVALEKVKQTTGNSQGIRCRVFYLGSSLPSAETELNTQLKELGLDQSEIYIEQRVLDLK
ncbi:MAG: hypothetical protein JKY95_11430 [Planctomycetaceae bacterium]|nr:hypothetical protein [Planctomycetaceae bacterium]